MRSVLLIDDDAVHAECFARHLGVCRYNVTQCSEPEEAIRMLSRADSSWKAIMWNVSRSYLDCLEMLRTINDFYQQNPLRRRPRILCFSSVYRGSQFMLDIRRLGARLFYE
jgi:CheY-like chemotaxis protein